MNIVFIALLDKYYPPEHSFVDGMLAKELAEVPGVRVRLCVSQTSRSLKRVVRYGSAICLPVLRQRRGFNRLRNFWIAASLLEYQIKREKKRGSRIVLFVRNDPIYLLAASLLRKKVDRVIFQSSFPHEEASGGIVKRSIAKMLYRLGGTRVDAVLAVSPIGLKRVQRLCPNARCGAYIPLLSDLPVASCKRAHERHGGKLQSVVFVYIGTHAASRKLEVVLRSIIKAVDRGIHASFLFIGGKDVEIDELMLVPSIQSLVRNEILRFEPYVSRSQIPEILAQADVGLSLIPPSPAYREASPTKLAEYMGAGLAVLASKGIPLQEQFVTESSGGLLVDWNVESIADGIVELCDDMVQLNTMKEKSRVYAATELNYERYLPVMLHLVTGDM